MLDDADDSRRNFLKCMAWAGTGALFAFRGRRGGLVKLLWYDGQGLCLFSKRLEKGHFVWPVTNTGRVSLTPAQLSMLLDHPC